MVMQRGSYPCPECKAQGVDTIYMYPTALGTHRKSKHNVAGRTNKYYEKHKAKKAALAVPTLGELADKALKCLYCERVFPRVNARTKHIHEDHPGLDAHKLTPQKGSYNESEEDKDNREYAIRCAGYLEGLCHGMASAKNFPPEEFTAGVARYLHAFTIR